MTDPYARFGNLLRRAVDSGMREPSAMALATADARGRPAVRMVLLKGFDAEGFVFYTNLESRKAAELEANAQAAICFYWPELEAQVRAEGTVRRVSDAEADAYFASRPRGSRIGAWASLQSRNMKTREELTERVKEIETRFTGAEIPRPPFWSGYRLRPDRIEFWSGKPDRLHERDLYVRREDGGWELELLYP